MEVSWLLKEKPVTWHQTTFQSYLGVPTATHGKDVKDVFSSAAYRPCTAARPRKGLPLVAALATVSAVIFLVYLCSLSTRGRISTPLFGRKLAGGADGKESNETDPCITHTDADTDTPPHTPQQHIENLTPSSSRHLPATTWYAGLDIQDQTLPSSEEIVAVPSLGLRGQQRHAKRREREGPSEEKVPKLFKQAAPNQETLPEPPSLDPDVELLIDSVLSQSKHMLQEEAWIVDDDIGNSNSATHSEDAASLQESVEPLSQPTAMETNQVAPLLSGALLAPGGAELTGTTPLSLFESVLSESSHTAQAVSLEEWLSGEEAADLVEALQPMPSPGAFPPVPSSIEPAEEATKSHAGLSGTMSEGTMHSGPLSSSEPLQSDSPRERSGEEWLRIPTGGPPVAPEQGLASPTLGPPILRNILSSTTSTSGTRILSQASSTLRPSVLRSLLSSTASTSGTPTLLQASSTLGPSTLRNLLSSVTSHSDTTSLSQGAIEGSIQANGSTRQSLSQLARSTTCVLLASRGWLGRMLGTVPEHILETHPFYRLPMKQLSLAAFSMVNAETLAASPRNMLLILSECRRLLKKTSLSHEETRALLGYTESLYGYATTTMPAHPGGFTSVFTIETLGRVLFVVDTLHCAAEVLGEASKKGLWWPRIVQHIQSARYKRRSTEHNSRMSNWSLPTLKALDVALDYYRIGKRPPVRLLVGLKLALLLQPQSTRFNNHKWNPWRADAEEWLESIQRSTQTSGQST